MLMEQTKIMFKDIAQFFLKKDRKIVKQSITIIFSHPL